MTTQHIGTLIIGAGTPACTDEQGIEQVKGARGAGRQRRPATEHDHCSRSWTVAWLGLKATDS
jgi:hypothetical protein